MVQLVPAWPSASLSSNVVLQSTRLERIPFYAGGPLHHKNENIKLSQSVALLLWPTEMGPWNFPLSLFVTPAHYFSIVNTQFYSLIALLYPPYAPRMATVSGNKAINNERDFFITLLFFIFVHFPFIS